MIIYLLHVESNDLAVSSEAEVGNGQVDVELKHSHELDFELEDFFSSVGFVADEHQVVDVWRHSILKRFGQLKSRRRITYVEFGSEEDRARAKQLHVFSLDALL